MKNIKKYKKKPIKKVKILSKNITLKKVKKVKKVKNKKSKVKQIKKK